MASSPRLTSSPLSPPRYNPLAEPVTPDANIRNRWRQSETTPTPGEASPTSTTVSSLAFDPARSTLRNILQASSSGPNTGTNFININSPARKVVIRADPALVTCFDPADKELYDLWAPRR